MSVRAGVVDDPARRWQGLRCREIAAVHTRDVRRDSSGWVLAVHGKGDRERIIPLRDDLAREIHRRPAGFVFPGTHDGHLSAQYVSRLISPPAWPGNPAA